MINYYEGQCLMREEPERFVFTRGRRNRQGLRGVEFFDSKIGPVDARSELQSFQISWSIICQLRIVSFDFEL